MENELRRGGHSNLDGGRVKRGKRGFAPVELLKLDAMGILDEEAEGQVEGTDAIDLGQGPNVLLESLDLGLAALQHATDGVNELLLVLVLLVESIVVGELHYGGVRHIFF